MKYLAIFAIFIVFFQICLCEEEKEEKEENNPLSRFLTFSFNNTSVGAGIAVVSFFAWALIVVIYISSLATSSAVGKSDFVRDVEYQQLPGSQTSGWSNEILAALDAAVSKQPATNKKADVLTSKIDAPTTSAYSTFKKRQSRLNPKLDRRYLGIQNPAQRRTDDDSESQFTKILRAARNMAPSFNQVIPAISGLSTVLSDIPEIVSEVSTSMSSRAARIYEDTNLQDCLLQTICYVSASPSNFIESRGFRSRRSDDLSTSDCQVFECTAATIGHRMYTVYRGVSGIAERLSTNNSETKSDARRQ